MTQDDLTSEMPPRPAQVYLAAAWSLARFIVTVLSLYGGYVLYRQFFASAEPENLIKSLQGWLALNPLVSELPLLLHALVFLYAAIGIFLGHSWGRSLFLWGSLATLLWNLRLVFRPPFVLTPVRSLVALSAGIWLLRRPRVLEYFEVDDRTPDFLKRRVGPISLDLAIALLLGIGLLVGEVWSLAHYQLPFSSTRTASGPNQSVERAPSAGAATVVLEPGQGSAASTDDLYAARDVLQTRLDAALQQGAVVAVEGKTIIVRLQAREDSPVAVRLASEVGSIQFLGSAEPLSGDITDRHDLELVLTQDHIASAVAEQYLPGEWQVAILLDAEGAEILAEYSTSHIGSYLMIVEDNMVIFSPSIQSPILDGKGVIASLELTDAQILAAKLTSGPLPVSLTVTE